MVITIAKQSEHIPRPENTIARSEKLHLWHVPENDELVRNANIEIADILAENMEVVEKALHVYDDYLFILKERQKVEALLADTTKFKREDFGREIARYEKTMRTIRDTMPKELRMNMFIIDCAELNNRLCVECDTLIDRILVKVSDYVLQDIAVHGIFKAVKDTGDNFISRANESTKILVEAEKAFELFK